MKSRTTNPDVASSAMRWDLPDQLAIKGKKDTKELVLSGQMLDNSNVRITVNCQLDARSCRRQIYRHAYKELSWFLIDTLGFSPLWMVLSLGRWG